ncbi:uncharacterized protein [Panulirus ornatus]|uniref:uncharacterized protein isoform X2 n=1 Tax=Panulirus ornatus TaxID=150431 RepID=UPI003A87D67C
MCTFLPSSDIMVNPSTNLAHYSCQVLPSSATTSPGLGSMRRYTVRTRRKMQMETHSLASTHSSTQVRRNFPYYSPPNISELNKFCDQHDCPRYRCQEKGKQCIRWSWYDVNDRLTNYSLFCGTLADQTNPDNPVSMTEGCWKMRMGTFMKEVCVCNTIFCNHSPGSPFVLTFMFLLPLLAQLLLVYSYNIS